VNRHELLASGLVFLLAAGCAARTRPERSAPAATDATPDCASIPGPAVRAPTEVSPHTKPDSTAATVSPDAIAPHLSSWVQPVAVLGPILRSARFRGPGPGFVPGLRDGDPYVAIETSDVLGILDRSNTTECCVTSCFLGRTPLWPKRGDGKRGTIVLIGPDPGGDLGALPLWCAGLVRGAPPEVGRAAIDVAYRQVVARKAPARWRRGPDGRGKEPPHIDVPPRRPGVWPPDPIRNWLEVKREPTP